jgi:hypothetical protein
VTDPLYPLLCIYVSFQPPVLLAIFWFYVLFSLDAQAVRRLVVLCCHFIFEFEIKPLVWQLDIKLNIKYFLRILYQYANF